MTGPAVAFSEADWEGTAKERLGELDWKPLEGQAIAPGIPMLGGHTGVHCAGPACGLTPFILKCAFQSEGRPRARLRVLPVNSRPARQSGWIAVCTDG